MNCPLLTLPQPSLQAPTSDAWPILGGIVIVFIVITGATLFIAHKTAFPQILAVLLVLPGLLMLLSGWIIDFCVMRPWEVTASQWQGINTVQLPIDCFDHYGELLHQTTSGLMRAYIALVTGTPAMLSLGLLVLRVLGRRQQRGKHVQEKPTA